MALNNFLYLTFHFIYLQFYFYKINNNHQCEFVKVIDFVDTNNIGLNNTVSDLNINANAKGIMLC